MTPTTLAAPPALLAAEEFFERYAHKRAELVDGVVIEEEPVPAARRGEICAEITRILGNFAKESKLGRVMSNDTMVRIRDKTVRGPDVLFVSYTRLPPGPAPDKLTDMVPELAIEVRSPSNDWPDIFGKVSDYLKAGVTAVLVVDPEQATGSVYRGSEIPQIFDNGDVLTIPDVLPGFAVPLKAFFA